MRVLVTGGAGFIGSHVVDRLVAHGHSVTVLDNLSTGRRENIADGVNMILSDVTDPYLARTLARRKFDAVIHHAAQVSVPRSLADPRFDAQVNLVGTMNLLEYAIQSRVSRFILASSAAVYGNPRSVPIAEDAPTRPLSPYAMSKLAAEQYLRETARHTDLQVVILRYANVYGPRQSIHGEPGVVCAMINQIVTRMPVIIHGDGQQKRDFVYVSDVAKANLLALRKDTPCGMYNVGTGVPTTILELKRLLAGPNGKAEFVPARPGDVRDSVLDSKAIRSKMGWRPAVSLEAGLARTWRYYRGAGKRATYSPLALASPSSTSASY